MSLLIPSHVLPTFSYLVPERLAHRVGVGAAVVVPLSGYSRLGVVVGFEESGERIGDSSLKEIQAIVGKILLPQSLVKLCGWAARAAALPLHAVLRMALPPGLEINTYEVRDPAPHWPWRMGSSVGRAQLRRILGGEGLKEAEIIGRVALAPALPTPRSVEWAMASEEANLEALHRAPRQRTLLEALLAGHGGGRPVQELLNAAGTGRDVLRRLVRRGSVRLEKRPEPARISYTKGSGAGLAAYAEGGEWALSRGGPWVWRMPGMEGVAAAAAVARAVVKRGKQVLVLAPEIGAVERLVEAFEGLLPAGLTVAPYHSELGQGRVPVYEAARRGEVDVIVGTRAAALVPLARLGAICVVDEPNEAHRAAPGYEGVPIHVRDIARSRGRIEDAPVLFFSPFPSLRLYAPESGVRRLPPRKPAYWPTVAVVDMRSTGALLSSTLLEVCRWTVRSEGRVGIVANRIGRATSVSCNRCGFVWICSECRVPLGLHDTSRGADVLSCASCGDEKSASACPDCGSGRRLRSVGLTVDRARARLAEALLVEVGLLTVSEREGEGAPVVVGTARCVLQKEWDLVVVLDVDPLLSGEAGSAEKGFRLLYGAAEASRGRLLVQTRSPEHPVLGAALRGDYEAFAEEELPKRRALLYPPHAHLAQVTLEGSEDAMRRAVELSLRPALAEGVEMLDPVPLVQSALVGNASGGARRPAWRVLLRSRRRGALADAATLVARLAAETSGRRGELRVRIVMDPEEV